MITRHISLLNISNEATKGKSETCTKRINKANRKISFTKGSQNFWNLGVFMLGFEQTLIKYSSAFTVNFTLKMLILWP